MFTLVLYFKIKAIEHQRWCHSKYNDLLSMDIDDIFLQNESKVQEHYFSIEMCPKCLRSSS